MSPFSIICLSPQDWSTDLPTNRQQVMSRAAARGHSVVFVETGGFLGSHLARALRTRPRREALSRLFRGWAPLPGITVRKSANVLPWTQKYALSARANVWATRRLLRTTAASLEAPVVTWMYDPCSVGATPASSALTVYDCVDDYAEQAPDPRRKAAIARADSRAGQEADLVFTTTTPLYERHLRHNRNTYHVLNAGDFSHFSAGAFGDVLASEASGLPRPILGFAGNFLASKVDFDLLVALSQEHPSWTLLLIGPARADTAENLERLAGLTNVTWLGPRPYAELPGYVAAFDVALIPYRRNAYTRSCFPLKLFEYLAAGKPVVASGLDELRGMEPDVVLAEGPEAFAAAIEQALAQTSEADRERRMALAAANSWEARTERLLGIAGEHLPAAP